MSCDRSMFDVHETLVCHEGAGMFFTSKPPAAVCCAQSQRNAVHKRNSAQGSCHRPSQSAAATANMPPGVLQVFRLDNLTTVRSMLQ